MTFVEFNPVPSGAGEASCESSEYNRIPKLIWRRWLVQVVRWDLRRAELRAGKSNAARTPRMAITTSNSIRVNPCFAQLQYFFKRSRAELLFTVVGHCR